jgi:hypothetical protein
LGRVLRKSETGVPDLAPAIYAHTIAAFEALKARSAGERPPNAHYRRSSGDPEDGGEVMTTCVGTQILWDAENAKMFGELCRRTLRFCEEGQWCLLTSAKGRILLVSSHRPLTSAPHSTAPVAQASPHQQGRCRPGVPA